MAKSVEIPQDIIDNVIAAVGDDARLLKQCTLVSSSFLLPCRKQLFSRISLDSNETCQGVQQFLVQNPVIQSFVRSISLKPEHTYSSDMSFEWVNGTSLLAILRLPFCRLDFFSINVHREHRWAVETLFTWNSFSSELKDALSNIIHLSTLKTLSLTNITQVPFAFFLHIVHLATLELRSLLPYDFDGKNSSSLIRAALKGVVIDRCVWSFGVEHKGYDILFICLFLTNSGRRRPYSHESIFLPFMCRLRCLEVNIELFSPFIQESLRILSFLIGSLCISLTSPTTLEHLKINIRFCGFNIYYSRHSSLLFYNNLRQIDVWSHLDLITTHPAGSRLQRVDINISYSWFHECEKPEEPDEEKVLKSVFDGLPLLHTKGILFVKSAMES